MPEVLKNNTLQYRQAQYLLGPRPGKLCYRSCTKPPSEQSRLAAEAAAAEKSRLAAEVAAAEQSRLAAENANTKKNS